MRKFPNKRIIIPPINTIKRPSLPLNVFTRLGTQVFESIPTGINIIAKNKTNVLDDNMENKILGFV
ncbi:MAG: hypothetical protein N2510_09550 [Ignavibacteria bacterium]|nr:hypothetical protein [Ignavibacteria bacterium]